MEKHPTCRACDYESRLEEPKGWMERQGEYHDFEKKERVYFVYVLCPICQLHAFYSLVQHKVFRNGSASYYVQDNLMAAMANIENARAEAEIIARLNNKGGK